VGVGKPSIRLARQPAFTNDADVASLGRESARWLGDYLNNVEEMAEIAGTAEPEPEEAETEATAVTES
jgi:hypothetical protein